MAWNAAPGRSGRMNFSATVRGTTCGIGGCRGQDWKGFRVGHAQKIFTRGRFRRHIAYDSGQKHGVALFRTFCKRDLERAEQRRRPSKKPVRLLNGNHDLRRVHRCCKGDFPHCDGHTFQLTESQTLAGHMGDFGKYEGERGSLSGPGGKSKSSTLVTKEALKSRRYDRSKPCRSI
jgi:hypothetical protein